MAEKMINFEGNWKRLLPRIKKAVKKNKLFEIALPPQEYQRLSQLNGPFFSGRGLGDSDLPKDIWKHLFLIPGNSPKLSARPRFSKVEVD